MNEKRLFELIAIGVVVTWPTCVCRGDLRDDALRAAKNATTFLTEQVSIEGGYLWRYSEDLALREGEGVVDTQTVWIQPPGTPTVGEAFLKLYDATGDEQFLAAARAAGESLRRGQMRSGGWQAMIEFEPKRRKKWAYRIDPARKKAKDQSSLDDDKTQAALRFAIQLDNALKFEDKAIHEMALYTLDGLLNKGQLENGGFPQVWTADKRRSALSQPASYPKSWPRSYPGHQEYWFRPTLNDNLAPDVIRTLLLAQKVYGEQKYQDAALKLADFLLLAQMPEPQPAWAQQYNYDMQPMWARKFEPPAVTGGESQGVIETLMHVYSVTGDRRYLEPIPKALDYLERSKLADGSLARFYELKSNRPLYFTKDYQLTYSDDDVTTHYGFKVTSRVNRLRTQYNELSRLSQDELQQSRKNSPVRQSRISEDAVRERISALDDRGAWITDEGLRYHKKPGPVIDMQSTVANLKLLANFLANSS